MDLLPGYVSSSLHSLLWAFSCLGLGSFVNRWLPNATRLEKTLINFLTGCIVWIMLALVLAIWHAFKPELVRVMVYVAGFGSLIAHGKTWWVWSREGLRFDWKILTLLIIFVTHGIYSLMPVISFDATCYHLPLASHILEHGSIIYTPFIFNSSFPKNYEILQAIALAIGGDVSASMVSWWFSTWTVLCLAALGNRIGNLSLGLWAGIAISLTPLWFQLGASPKNEVGMAFGITLLVLAIVMRAPGWVFGLVIGWLGGCKYYGFEIGGIAFIAWIIQNRPGWRSVLTCIGVIIIAAGFWYARNAWLFADPVYPYYFSLISSFGEPRVADAGEYAFDVYSQFDQFASPTTLIGWITVPFRMLLNSEPNFSERAEYCWKYIGWLAILWPFAVIPIVKRHRNLVGPFVMILLSTLLWVFVHGIIYLRFLTPLLVLMYFFSFLVISDLLPGLNAKPVVSKIATILLCLLAVLHLIGPTAPFRLIDMPLSSDERDYFLTHAIAGYPIIQELNRLDPPPTVYYLYGEHARHYCDFPVYSGWRTPYGFGKFQEHAESGTELARWLEEIEVDILIINYLRGSALPQEVSDALISEEFTGIYNLKIPMYISNAVYVHRDLEIEFPLQVDDSALSDPTD